MGRIAAIQSMAARAGVFATSFSSAVAAQESSSPAEPAVNTRTRPETGFDSTVGSPPSTQLPPGATRWQASIGLAATQAGIDPKLLTALVWTESGFKPEAVSSAGAIGLTQLMPATAEGLGVDPYDPDQNLAGGARFLKAMIDRFGSVELGLAAYNIGPAAVDAQLGAGRTDIAGGYTTTVLDHYRNLGGTT
jgi:soluble lytic murein transglycosylase-like protein